MGRIDRFAAWRRAMLPALATFFIVAARMAIAQELVVTTGTALGGSPQQAPMVVLPDVGSNLVSPQVNLVTPLGVGLSTHGLALVSATRALASQILQPYIDVIDTSTSTLVEQFQLPSPALNVFYDGLGTLAANPAHTFVLVAGGLNTLWAIAAPFDHTAAVTMVTLPSPVGTAQTRAIAFDPVSGRAYVAVETGILALDPPYTSIAFTIPSSNGVNGTFGPLTGDIAMSPDGATLAATRSGPSGWLSDVRLFHAPFSATSVPDVVAIAGAALDGLTFTPDSSQLLITDNTVRTAPQSPRVYIVAAPYSATSTVTTLTFSVGTSSTGFEDIDISADGQLAALSGGTTGLPDPIVVLKAPFTPAGFTYHLYPIPALSYPYQQGGRGDGTARFWSTAISPLPPPQLYVDPSVSPSASSGFGLQVIEGNSGTTDAILPVHLTGASTQSVSVDFTTVDGTATVADNDYIAASGTLTFAPGETTKTITIKVVGDTRYEYNDRFTVVLSNPINATILGNHPGFSDTALVAIVNDDAGTPIGITTTALPDGVTGVPYSFQLEGGGVTPLTWAVDSLDSGLAVDPVTGIISGIPIFAGTFSPGIVLKDGGGFTASKILPLKVTGPGIPFLVFSNNPLDFGNVAVGSTSTAPRVAVKNLGAVDLVLGSPFLTTIAGSDFTLATGPFACTPGEAIAPSDQCFIYFNFSPQAAGPRSATLTLSSNVAPAAITLTGNGTSSTTPTVSIANAVSVAEGNTGTTPMTFNVTLSAASASAVTVHYAASGGTATSGVDYALAGTGTLTFAAGTTTQTIAVNIIGDMQPEPDETVVITLSNPSGALLGTATASGTILDDDAGAPVLTLVSGVGDFGSQIVATTSAPHTFALANNGGSNVVLATPFAVLPTGSAFAVVSGPNACTGGSTLAPSGICNIYITFTPPTPGDTAAVDVLSSTAPDIVVTLHGVGVIVASESQPISTLSPAALGWLVFMVAIIGFRARRRIR